jgi:hypothetical protein
MHAPVRGVKQSPTGAGDPAFGRVNKSYVQQVCVNARSLLKPCVTAIGGCEHAACCVDSPAQTIPHKAGRRESCARAVVDDAVVSRSAAIAGLQDGRASTHQPTVLFVHEGAAQQQILRRQSLF